jgi:uncharacterized protein YjbJ (UPF0337 family)
MDHKMNENVISGKWKEIKGELQKLWGRLTDDEIEQAKGDLSSFTGTVQRKYGSAQDDVRRQFNDLVGKYDKTENSH